MDRREYGEWVPDFDPWVWVAAAVLVGLFIMRLYSYGPVRSGAPASRGDCTVGYVEVPAQVWEII